MSATGWTVLSDSETETPSGQYTPDHPFCPHPAYIVIEESHATLSDAVVDAEWQLLQGESTHRDNLQAMHDLLPDRSFSPPPPEANPPRISISSMRFPSPYSEDGGYGRGSNSSGEDSDSDDSTSGSDSEGSASASGSRSTASSGMGYGGDEEAGENARGDWISHHDWAQRTPCWDGEEIPELDVQYAVHEHIHNTFIGDQNYPVACKMSVLDDDDPEARCGAVIKKDKGTLKRHIWGKTHLDARMHCGRCGGSTRLDNFRRHICKA
ncbi:hypothetical protein K466DRAFT_564832 [Polyporus arcularius HHB13444]|uniref:Uncharacterized protein n=1 Tax=Polyporus arcularius HHB13444 TaxID=1314778 RepID=A0A5C3PH52_9APHY|nr:hypothetical protein K466DRAFT_564832 [Polyporus arcularius HHB13444]